MDGNEKFVDRLEEQARALGADFFGVADMTLAASHVREQGGEMLAQFPRSISIGITMPHAIVDELPRRHDPAVALAYETHSYYLINERLDLTSSHLSSMLQREGYRAFPVKASLTVNEEKLWGHISHKLSAHLAGLGWIGKSCLLITPEVGPRVRWATVLTDAPLPAGKPMAERCGPCTECVDNCPVGAFSGRTFDPAKPRSWLYDAHRCSDFLDRDLSTPGAWVCGMCVYVCPYGKKASRKIRSRANLLASAPD